MGLQPFYDKWPHRSLWVGSRASRRQLAVGGTPNCLNYCVFFVLYAQFRNVAAGRRIQAGGPRFEDQCTM